MCNHLAGYAVSDIVARIGKRYIEGLEAWGGDREKLPYVRRYVHPDAEEALSTLAQKSQERFSGVAAQ